MAGATTPIPLAVIPEPYFSLLLSLIALMVLVVGGYVAMRVLRRWARGGTERDTAVNSDYASFRELYERGELTEEEYQRIRSRMNRKLRADLGAPPSPLRGSVPEEEPLTDIQILDPMTDIRPSPPPAEPPPPRPPDPDDRETVVSLSFRAVPEGTLIGLDQGPFATEGRFELHRAGWTDTLERLASFLR